MKNHPDRTDLLKAINTKSFEIENHLNECLDCNEIFNFLNLYQVAGKTELVNAPTYLIEKAVLLIDRKNVLAHIKSLTASLIFDSWADLQPAGTRDSSVCDDRRIQFKADNIMFDLRAEKVKSQWNFTAQILTNDEQEDEIKILIGKNSYSVNEFGLIQWSSKNPPKKIKLIDNSTTFTLPDIRWKL